MKIYQKAAQTAGAPALNVELRRFALDSGELRYNLLPAALVPSFDGSFEQHVGALTMSTIRRAAALANHCVVAVWVN